ncbi:hypothetical protein, partial [uncultured Corynebacterium sp.]|uniref:hypothetical protein n=1 Tax=uncultured Corynebacterium sp. TaxID=159447 RepID=UPI002599458B
RNGGRLKHPDPQVLTIARAAAARRNPCLGQIRGQIPAIYTDESPPTGNVIQATTSIHEDQRCHIVNDPGRLAFAEDCRHLAEFAGDLPVVMQFDAHCEVLPTST